MWRSLACAAGLVVLVATPGSGQSARPGMRLTVTRVAPTGGFTANGFLVVPGATIARTPAPECGGGAIRVDARGRDARGRIRAAHLVTIASASPRDVAIGAGPCDAQVEVTLEDGTAQSAQRGTVHTTRVGADGIEATFDSSVIDADGVPTTIGGRVTLPSR